MRFSLLLVAELTLVVGACASTPAKLSENARPAAGDQQVADVVPHDASPAAAELPAVAVVPECHRFCSSTARACGHWGRVGPSGNACRGPGCQSRPPRWLDCDPACCDSEQASRLSAQTVVLGDLLMALRSSDASAATTALGAHSLSVDCSSTIWQALDAERERKTCSAGRVAIDDTLSRLEMHMTRRIAQPGAARASLRLLAEGAPEAWSEAMRAILVKTRNQDELSAMEAGDSMTGELMFLGDVTARLVKESSDEAAQLILTRRSRGKRR